MQQRKDDAKGLYTLMDTDEVNEEEYGAAGCSGKELHKVGERHQAWDDVIGYEFKLGVTRQARREDIEYFRQMKVYNEVFIEECK